MMNLDTGKISNVVFNEDFADGIWTKHAANPVAAIFARRLLTGTWR